MTRAWRQSRYDKAGPAGDSRPISTAPWTGRDTRRSSTALLAAETFPMREWERDTPFFDGCLPVEEMASRGRETLRFGPMKPVGLADPRTPGRRSHAVVQLRQDNALGNAVQHGGVSDAPEAWRADAHLPHDSRSRTRAFRPSRRAHRNTFINAPRLLDGRLRLKAAPRLRFAGQIAGVEGYVESAAIGLVAGRFAAGRGAPPPPETALGALLGHITGGGDAATFQPMNVNFGLFPPLAGRVASASANAPIAAGRSPRSMPGSPAPRRWTRRASRQRARTTPACDPTPAACRADPGPMSHAESRSAACGDSRRWSMRRPRSASNARP